MNETIEKNFDNPIDPENRYTDFKSSVTRSSFFKKNTHGEIVKPLFTLKCKKLNNPLSFSGL